MSLGHAALSGVATRLSRIAVNASKFSDDETWRASTGPHRGDLRARARECLAAKLEPEETAEEVD